MPTSLTVHEWSLTRWKLGGANVKILAASYGIAEIEPGQLPVKEEHQRCTCLPSLRPKFQSSPQTGSRVPPRLIDLTSQMRQQYEQGGFVVLSGLGCCSFPDPAPLRRKCLTVIYEGTNEYEEQNCYVRMLSGAAIVAACAGLMPTSFTVSFVQSSWPIGLLTTTASATGSGMMGFGAWESCNQARAQGSECYIC